MEDKLETYIDKLEQSNSVIIQTPTLFTNSVLIMRNVHNG